MFFSYFAILDKSNPDESIAFRRRMTSNKKGEIELARTLAQRVMQLRQMKNMTVLDLAKACRWEIRRIEDIEAGLEVWLSVHDRNVLARGLKQVPAILAEVEATPDEMFADADKRKGIDLEELAARVLAGEANLPCPRCGKILKSQIETASDYEGKPIHFARAYCPVCPFALR